MVQPPQAHNHGKYDNNGKSRYFRFDDDNKMNYIHLQIYLFVTLDISGSRVRYLYSTVIFLQHAVNRHPIIACPWGRGAIPFVIFVLGVIPWSTLCCMHKAVLNYIIKARNCICTWFESNFYNGMRNVLKSFRCTSCVSEENTTKYRLHQRHVI